MQVLCILYSFIYRKIKSNNVTIIALAYGYKYLLKYRNNINKFFPSVEQTIFTIIIKKYKELKADLYSLPLFTVGLPSEENIKSLCVVHPIHCNKELSLKERILYYNDDNFYYTSNTNRYVIVRRIILQSNFSSIIDIIKSNNLILILPDQSCIIPYCFYYMDLYYGDKLLIEKLNNNNIQYRESTFLRHPLVPSKYKAIKKIKFNSVFFISFDLFYVF